MPDPSETEAAVVSDEEGEEAQRMEEETRALVAALASCRPDVWLMKKRVALIASVQDHLRRHAAARRALASWKDLRCSSLHAYRRIVPLYVLCIQLESDDSNGTILQDLCNCLTRLLLSAHNVDLVDQCRRQLQTDLTPPAATRVACSLRSSPHVLTAAALAVGLKNDTDDKKDDTDDKKDDTDDDDYWCTAVLQYSLETWSSREDLQLGHAFLERVTTAAWTTVISPALLLKVRSHPDKALPTLGGWLQGVNVATSISDDWLQALWHKHVATSSGGRNSRLQQASQVLELWAQQSAETWSRISTAVATAQVTLPTPARATAFGLLQNLAAAAELVVNPTVIAGVVQGLLALIAKETKPEQKVAGHQALLEWMVLAKRQKEEEGYGTAIEFVRQNAAVLSLLVERVHPDLLESMVVDLWSTSWLQKLESMVTAASGSKKSAQDGLVALYLILLYASQTNKAIPAFAVKVLSVGSSSTFKNDPSFVFSQTVRDAVSTHALSSMILPRTLALYTQLASHDDEHDDQLVSLFSPDKVTAAARILATCVLYPMSTHEPSLERTRKDQYASNSIVACLETILTYQPAAASGLVQALLQAVNAASLNFEETVAGWNASQQARESETTTTSIKGQGSEHAPHRGFDANAVRRVARLLAHQQLRRVDASVLLLMHAGASLRSEGHQRAALIVNTRNVIRDVILPGSDEDRRAMAQEIVRLTTQCHFGLEDDAEEVSEAIHRAGLSLLMSLGGIASNFSPEDNDPENEDLKPYAYAHSMCLEDIATGLSSRLTEVLEKVESLSVKDVDILLSPMGTLFDDEDKTKVESKKTSGRRLNDDEEWEMEMKRELAAKKNGPSSAVTLSTEQKKLVADQDRARKQTASLLDGDFPRALDAIRSFASADIEIGNECLPVCTESVLRAAVSICPAAKLVSSLRANSYVTLKTLATCVYEIEEVHAPTMAHALLLSYRRAKGVNSTISGGESPSQLTVSALPSPCAPAACVVFEMDRLGDCLSGPSFFFLFPVLQACLMGPRTPVGCDGALRVLERHTAMLHGDEADSTVVSRRKEMAVCVLELLKHDRSQAFRNPSAFETLTACYQANIVSEGTPSLTTSELSPLLDERGALGGRNCRLGSMFALALIADNHRKTIESNPLVENRIWLNCFEQDEEVRRAARKAWALAHGKSTDEPGLASPSPLFAAPLLPLLSHSDPSVARAAADAFASALAIHTKSVGRNVEMLCKTYIDSVPPPAAGSVPAPTAHLKPAKPVVAPVKKKKATPLSGLPKKKSATKKSALSIAGIGKPKTTKKKSTHSALLKPKMERFLDDAALADQFKTVEKKQENAEEKDTPSKVAVRLGVLSAVAAVTRLTTSVDIDEDTLELLTSFLMAYGIADGEEKVKSAARDALRDIVASNGGSEEAIAFLLPHLEEVLKTGVASESSLGSLSTMKIPKDVSASDRRKEGAVVALGSVAIHLKGSEYESKVDETIDLLIDALKTPSEDVQLSVADALTKLMKKGKTKERIEELLNEFLKNCLVGDSLAVRRGSAYGLSAAVKGSGIATLKKYEIVRKLDEACASGDASEKEGALFAIELLSSRLGLLFEPYVIVLLPSLLKSFSDSSDYVRKAAADTVGLIMSKLSAHGVKLVMPAVLEAFNDPAWRTKQASIHMLGAMSHLAPKQLASALPKVVPKLTEAFSDTHPKVKASAQEALDEISTVVRNPEISSISPVLLRALTDPADHTIKALEVLIETEFLHAIDAPSLALIVPILHRGLRDRGATTKRFAALISANITTMVNDAKEMIPYLPTLLPDLQSSLLDPIPDVRSTAAKALGSLTRSLGDHILPELRPWLVKKLRDEACSSAERSGAAQGLTEVLIVSGTEIVDDTMRNEILPLRSHPEPSTREGVLWMLSFLPPALGQGFTPLIDVSLPALISGLSDDSEPVRDVAMRAGRVLIRSHGKVHVDKILPSLEAGLSDDDHRIRVASLSLLGDLLGMIGGTSVVKGEGDTQDDIRKAERAQAQIALALGTETRRRVLSSLYMARCDSVHAVRQSALQVWKTVVSVTARTLRDILSVLVSKIIDDLASGHEEKTVVAGRCLGDIVGKLGESVLPQIIPVLRSSLYDGDEHTKRGVCVGLTEVISCSTRDQILRFLEIIVKVVQDALCDESVGVRKVAAASFQSLYSIVGSRAFDEVVPSLMVALENGESDENSRVRALNGLTGILSVRSRELLPYIVPRLIQRPFTENHTKALAGVVEVTGGTISAHFPSIIPAILGELSELDDEDEKKPIVRQVSKACCRFVDEDGVSILVSQIASKCSSDKPALRRECCRMFEDTITERAEKADFYEQIPIMVREMLYRLNDDDPSVLKANHAAFTALSTHVPAEELVQHVEFMRNLLASMVSDARRRKGGVGDGEFLLPGFNMPKGLQPIIPIYQRGILYGSPTIREVSAAGLGEAISLTSTKYLAGPLVVKMTGPLLRIVGDRNPANVKVAILKTLGLVLVKGGPSLRAFVPQFQTTFVKALSDPSRQVRLQAIGSLSLLMPLSTRVDPLIKELVSGSLGKNANAEGLAAAAVQTATLEALGAVLEKGGAKAKLPASVPSALNASKELIGSADEEIRESAAKVMGASCALLGAAVTLDVLREDVSPLSESESSAERHGAACAIFRVLASKVGSELGADTVKSLKTRSLGFLSDDKSAVREAGCVALLSACGRSPDAKASFMSIESELLKILDNPRESMDMHQAAARGLCAALVMIEGNRRIETIGLGLVDACLKLALSGAQRVQFAFNDVLWLALNVSEGQDGLEKYSGMAVFDNVRSMKSLYSKVLTRMKAVTIMD